MRTVLLFLLFLFFVNIPQEVHAHDLLPQAVVEYLKEHPNATASEIEKIAEDASSQETAYLLGTKESVTSNAFRFIKLGIYHILTGPDHILFVLSLLLVFVSIKNTLTLISAFTLAHSSTLLLAGTSMLTLSSKVVEPVIAFSISYVAITSVFFKDKRFLGGGKPAVVFFFGLFHGLGFAGLLQEIQIPYDKFLSSVVSFNIGVELGQIFIIALVLPLIYCFRTKQWYGRFIQVVAGTFGVIGVMWGIQRIFL